MMSPIKATIDYDDSIIKAIYEVVYNNVSFVPVQKNKEIVGVVRTVELVYALENIITSEKLG